MDNTNKCYICDQELIKEGHKLLNFLGEETIICCDICFEDPKKVTKCYYINENYLGKIDRMNAGKLIKKDLAISKDLDSIYVVNPINEKKCILCNDIKNKELVKNKICHICLKEKKEIGVNYIVNKDNKKVRVISITKAKVLEEKKIIKKIEENYYVYSNKIDYFFTNIIFRIIKKNIIVSKSGKWSCESTNSEAKELIKFNLAEKIDKKTIRMTVNIEDFKANIIKRDKRRCKICGKKAHGVFSKSEIKVYSNSFCACINCEYILDPKKYLNWLNLIERNFNLFDLLRKNEKKENVWLYDKTKKLKYRISKNDAKKLLEESMLSKLNNKNYILNYDVHSFREFIINRENKTCHYCGKKGKTVDHVIPKSKGGLTTPKNCVCACEKCNTKKGNTDKENFITFINQ